MPLCVKCHQNEATIHFTTVVDRTEDEIVHLCKQCASPTGLHTLDPKEFETLSVTGKKCEFCRQSAFSGVMGAGAPIYWCFGCGQEFGRIFEAVRREAAQSPVDVRWNLDAIRHFGADHAMQVAEIAAGYVDDGVVSFGIGGDEERGPAGWFTDVYRFARAKGLRLTAHAGETAGPESVWAALRLGAERIGHGIRAVDDPALVRHLRDESIALEICISSNVATGAVPSLRAHPVRRLYDAGVPITLNTDDPGLFGTTLEKEYNLAAREFGFSERELAQIAENGFRYAFAGATPEPPDVKKAGLRS